MIPATDFISVDVRWNNGTQNSEDPLPPVSVSLVFQDYSSHWWNWCKCWNLYVFRRNIQLEKLNIKRSRNHNCNHTTANRSTDLSKATLIACFTLMFLIFNSSLFSEWFVLPLEMTEHFAKCYFSCWYNSFDRHRLTPYLVRDALNVTFWSKLLSLLIL